MSTDPNEAEVRRLLADHGELVRVGKHEVWRLPDGGIFPVRLKGRQGREHAWRNALRALRARLRGTKPPRGRPA